MKDCGDCRSWEQKCDNLKYSLTKLRDKYDELEKRYNKANDQLNVAESKIRTELEPRIKSEQRSYDRYVSDGGGDECFSNGMSGRCGFDCSIFGSKNECFEGMTKEAALYAYAEYTQTGIILEIIDAMGLKAEARLIDIEYLLKQKKVQEDELAKTIEKLKQLDLATDN